MGILKIVGFFSFFYPSAEKIKLENGGVEGGIDQSCSLNQWRILKATCKTWRNAGRIFLGRRKQTGKSGWTEPGLGFLSVLLCLVGWMGELWQRARRFRLQASYTTGGKEERCALTLLLSQTPRFCQQGSVRAIRGKSGNVRDVDGFSPTDIPNRSGVKEGKPNTVRREVAACLLYCGHEGNPPFCSVWRCHQASGCCRWGDSSISLTFMGLPF